MNQATTKIMDGEEKEGVHKVPIWRGSLRPVGAELHIRVGRQVK